MKTLNAVWTPIDLEYVSSLKRLEFILAGWERTPYMSGQRLRSVQADCIGFALGAIDDADGRKRALGPKIPADTAFHDPERAFQSVLDLRRAYQPNIEVKNGKLQPFDIAVVGPANGGPAHVMLVGVRPNTLWHTTQGVGVHQTGWAIHAGHDRLIAAYRMMDRWRWVPLCNS